MVSSDAVKAFIIGCYGEIPADTFADRTDAMPILPPNWGTQNSDLVHQFITFPARDPNLLTSIYYYESQVRAAAAAAPAAAAAAAAPVDDEDPLVDSDDE